MQEVWRRVSLLKITLISNISQMHLDYLSDLKIKTLSLKLIMKFEKVSLNKLYRTFRRFCPSKYS